MLAIESFEVFAYVFNITRQSPIAMASLFLSCNKNYQKRALKHKK